MIQKLKFSILILSGTALFSCAVLHHVQLSEIDNSAKVDWQPVSVKVSETGVDLKDVKNIANAVQSKEAKQAADILSMFQIGPRTGAPVYVENYANDLIRQIHKECPSGRLTGLTSVRETRKYPVISGEIVKVTGYCARSLRQTRSEDL